MIVINEKNTNLIIDNILVFHINKINSLYENYIDYINKFLLQKIELSSLKEISSEKSLEDKFHNVLVRQIKKLFEPKKSKFEGNSLLTEITKEDIGINQLNQSFTKIILAPRKGDYEYNLAILETESELKSMLNYLLKLGSKCFLNKNETINVEDLKIFTQALNENIHTHTSKLVHSSSKILLNNSVHDKNFLKIGLNSRSLNFGIDNTSNNSGGIGRDNVAVLEALISKFIFAGKTTSLSVILLGLINSTQKNIKLNIEEELLLSIFNLHNIDINLLIKNFIETSLDKDLIYTSQVLFYSPKEENKFINIIPAPSVKIFSALCLIENDIIEKQKNLENKKYKFHAVKSVASNPANISQFASNKGGSFPRFLCIPYIKKLSIRDERKFFKIRELLEKNKITINKSPTLQVLSYSLFLKNSEKKLQLPNAKIKEMSLNFIDELANIICFSINKVKQELVNLDKENLINKISPNIVKKSIQKYILNEPLLNDEMENLVDFLAKNFEDYNYLSENEKSILKNKIKENLCS